MKNRIIVQCILWLFKLLTPYRGKSHKEEIDKFIRYQIEREKDYVNNHYWFVQQYDEDIRMLCCSSLAKGIIKEIKTEGNTYLGMMKSLKPKNDFEKGVMSSVNYIYFIQHCMNPS